MTASIEARIKATRLVVFDFDGVFTDNLVYVFEDGREAVRCSRGDGLGVEMLHRLGLHVVVLSTERNPVVGARSQKLGVRCIQGCRDKLAALRELMRELDVSCDEVAYLGNDVNDLDCLSEVGLPIVVQDAHSDVVGVAAFRTERPGGHGAVREVCDLFATVRGALDLRAGTRGIAAAASALALFFVFSASPVSAQSGDAGERGRVQLGPLRVKPSVALSDFGVDGNVFNEVENPKKDFMFALSPQLDAQLRAGRSRTTLLGRADLIYFQKYSSERSVDGTFDARLEVPINRLMPFVETKLFQGRQRLGYEIDLRSRRVMRTLVAGMEARVGGRTRVRASATQTAYRYDADSFFLGSNLQEALNHTTESVGLEFRRDLSVLTTFVVQGEALRDRFEFARERNAKSIRVMAGFDTDPLALIGGKVRIGYRTFNGLGGGVRAFTGVVASATSGFTLKGRTRIEATVDRDVTYSFEALYPYFVLTGGTLSLTPRLTAKWDVQARAGAQHLAYRVVEGVGGGNRIDRHVEFGLGAGYHLGREMRISLNVDRERRTSPFQRRAFEGYRIGSSVTYGQ